MKVIRWLSYYLVITVNEYLTYRDVLTNKNKFTREEYMAYILYLIALYVCSILIMIFMHKFKNTKLTNLIFCLTR